MLRPDSVLRSWKNGTRTGEHFGPRRVGEWAGIWDEEVLRCLGGCQRQILLGPVTEAREAEKKERMEGVKEWRQCGHKRFEHPLLHTCRTHFGVSTCEVTSCCCLLSSGTGYSCEVLELCRSASSVDGISHLTSAQAETVPQGDGVVLA